ncbi:hypothetical protein H9P43_007475 [Blastocladiella emersonii ATCC 22665]|nr:hypothetical protein H9P43_007475 [Blastocladiella emersonii ATCC 22665]
MDTAPAAASDAPALPADLRPASSSSPSSSSSSPPSLDRPDSGIALSSHNSGHPSSSSASSTSSSSDAGAAPNPPDSDPEPAAPAPPHSAAASHPRGPPDDTFDPAAAAALDDAPLSAAQHPTGAAPVFDHVRDGDGDGDGDEDAYDSAAAPPVDLAEDTDADPAATATPASPATAAKSYTCDECGAAFARLQNLKSHVLTHRNLRPFACDVCQQSFSRQHDLKRHQRLHTGARPYTCTHCFRSFARLDALTRHRDSHSCHMVNLPPDLRDAAVASVNRAMAAGGTSIPMLHQQHPNPLPPPPLTLHPQSPAHDLPPASAHGTGYPDLHHDPPAMHPPHRPPPTSASQSQAQQQQQQQQQSQSQSHSRAQDGYHDQFYDSQQQQQQQLHVDQRMQQLVQDNMWLMDRVGAVEHQLAVERDVIAQQSRQIRDLLVEVRLL